MTNIEIAIKHFERKSKSYNGVISASEILEVLYFMKQAEEQKLNIVGIGYHMYNDEDIRNVSTDRLFERGFIIEKRS